MAAVPAFSVFSAASELVVTAGVFYVLGRAFYRNELRGALLAIILAFEAFVNMGYMVYRIAIFRPGLATTGSMGILLALHGTLSLFMFALLVAFAVEAGRLKRQGRNLVRERPRATAAFVAFWSLSVLSGEALFLTSLAR